MLQLRFLGRLAAVAVCAGWALAAAHTAPAKRVDGASIRANGAETRDWPSHGLDDAETRFPKLKQIDTANVHQPGLAWSYDLDSSRGVVESTPLVVDGVMHGTASWKIKAFIQGTADAIRPN